MSKINIPINLATDPFRRDRPVLVASVAVAGLLTLTLLLMASMIVREHNSASSQRAMVDRLSNQATRVSAQLNALDGTLRLPENAVVLERSIFLNSLIQRKAISWTHIFSDLEKVMPYNVRLVSVRLPQVDYQNQVLLDMVVGADDSAPVLDFLKRLEKAPQFGPTSVLNSIPPSQTDKLWKYRISVSYAQGSAAFQAAANRVPDRPAASAPASPTTPTPSATPVVAPASAPAPTPAVQGATPAAQPAPTRMPWSRTPVSNQPASNPAAVAPAGAVPPGLSGAAPGPPANLLAPAVPAPPLKQVTR